MLRQHTAGVAAPKRTRNRVCPIATAIRRLVIERGHLGITNTMLQHETRSDSNHVGTVLAKMTNAGEIHGARLEGLPKHWFANAELAMRWLTANPPQPKPAPTPRPRELQRTAPAHRHRPANRTASARHADVPVTVPGHVQVQRVAAPTHDIRYQCAPGERPAGAGFAAAGIGRDITTGQAWGQPA